MSEFSKSPDTEIILTSTMIHILIALMDGEKHGFDILLEIEAISNGDIVLGPGSLFTSIKRLLNAGLVEQSDERSDPNLDAQRRRYYRLTGLGGRLLQSELQRQVSRSKVNRVEDFLGNAFVGGAG